MNFIFVFVLGYHKDRPKELGIWGCGAKELGILGDAAGVWDFFGWAPFARLRGIFLARTTILRNFAAIPVRMELGVFRAAKFSGEGRYSAFMTHEREEVGD